MRRIILWVTVAVIIAALVVTMSGLALADANPNDHNCNGQFFSDRAPETQSGGQQGQRAKTQAQQGIRSDVLKEFVGAQANCGDNGVPG